MIVIPNSEIKPIAAEILKSRPETNSPNIPPPIANGKPAKTKKLSRQELNRQNKRITISDKLKGTIKMSLAFAFCRSSNSPAQTIL